MRLSAHACAAWQRMSNVATSATSSPVPAFALYGEAPRTYDERILHVETIASRSAAYGWRIDRHVHRTLHQLLFAISGGGAAFAEDAVIRYRPPALVVVPAGTVHGFEFEPGTRGFVVSMTDDLLDEASRREPGIKALFERPSTLECSRGAVRAADLEQSFKLFAREAGRDGSGRALALEGWLGVILAKTLRLSDVCPETRDAARRRRRALVARFREMVDRDLGKGTSVAGYAAALNVSESRLRHACMSVTEQSPIQLVHARVLLEAKRQLLYSSKSVSEIAYALGFEPAYFARFFSRRTGVSPSLFRARGPVC